MKNHFGDNLAYLRKINRLDQSDVAKLVKKSVATISFWEKSKREPTVEDVYLLSIYFGVDMETLYFGNISSVKPVR